MWNLQFTASWLHKNNTLKYINLVRTYQISRIDRLLRALSRVNNVCFSTTQKSEIMQALELTHCFSDTEVIAQVYKLLFEELFPQHTFDIFYY